MKKQVSFYAPPHLTVVEFKIERGYAASFGTNQVVNMLNEQFAVEMEMTNNGDFVGSYLGDADQGHFHDESNPTASSPWTFENGSHF